MHEVQNVIHVCYPMGHIYLMFLEYGGSIGSRNICTRNNNCNNSDTCLISYLRDVT